MGRKNHPIFEKSSQNSYRVKKCKIIYDKAKFESPKHLQLTPFETKKQIQQTNFETAYVCENVKKYNCKKVAQMLPK